jgi:hypothetical protein
MVEDSTEVRVWSCPICGEAIDVRLQWRAKGVGLIKALHVDDMDARLHMAWHQMCTCRWEPIPPEAPQAILRHPDIDCPVH